MNCIRNGSYGRVYPTSGSCRRVNGVLCQGCHHWQSYSGTLRLEFNESYVTHASTLPTLSYPGGLGADSSGIALLQVSATVNFPKPMMRKHLYRLHCAGHTHRPSHRLSTPCPRADTF